VVGAQLERSSRRIYSLNTKIPPVEKDCRWLRSVRERFYLAKQYIRRQRSLVVNAMSAWSQVAAGTSATLSDAGRSQLAILRTAV
jgi:hypothetical protein